MGTRSVYTKKLIGMDSYTDLLLTRPQTPNLGVSTGLNLQAWEESQLRMRNNEATRLFTNAHFFQNAAVPSVAPNMAAVSSQNLHITKFWKYGCLRSDNDIEGWI
jgi:uncharacterized NAD(P)/FAD-binding protein YdhS